MTCSDGRPPHRRLHRVRRKQGVGGRDRPGHDGVGEFTVKRAPAPAHPQLTVMRGLVPRIHVCEKKARRTQPRWQKTVS